MRKRIYITDKELASIIEVTPKTISRMVNGFVRGGKKRKTLSLIERKLVDAKPESFGGYRRWKIENIVKAFELNERKIFECIGV